MNLHVDGDRPRLGLALGSGAARGLSHLGVIRTLEAVGLAPDVIAGTSVGAVMGAVYAAGLLDGYEAWLRGLDRRRLVKYFDWSLRGGLVKAERALEYLASQAPVGSLEELRLPLVAVAADIHTGEEVWLQRGPLVESLRAAITMPVMVAPTQLDGRWLIDGAVLNPVPVNVCRSLGAEIVIAVDPSTNLLGGRFPNGKRRPTIFDVFGGGIEIMQKELARGRAIAHPPDLLITPQVQHLGRFDFHRAAEAIAEGERAAREALATYPRTLARRP